ncbi:hypothetical protein KGP36_01630 [Patescibacteria group bacterium]|nr:hypothetical protein [Patescibacteria group bacterium]
MPVPQTAWADLIAQIASEQREIEDTQADFSDYEPMLPYWDQTDIENFLLEISQRKLRDLNPDALQAAGSDAVTIITGTSVTLPQNAIGVSGALIQLNNGDTTWKPAQRVSISQWYQAYNASASNFTVYAILANGQIAFKGYQIQLTVLVEPALGSWQNDDLILPPAGFDEERKEWVHGRLAVQDFEPEGAL